VAPDPFIAEGSLAAFRNSSAVTILLLPVRVRYQTSFAFAHRKTAAHKLAVRELPENFLPETGMVERDILRLPATCAHAAHKVRMQSRRDHTVFFKDALPLRPKPPARKGTKTPLCQILYGG